MPYVKYKVKDYAEGQLLAGISAGALALQLKAGEGAKFPTFTVGEKAIGTIEKRTGNVVTARERITITAKTTDTFTITRSFGGDTAIAFSANDYFCLHVNADVVQDVQDEVTNLGNIKLNSAGGLRTALTAWRLYYSNTSGAETALALGANGTFLMSNGASSAPSWGTPSVDINGQTTATPATNDSFVFYDVASAGNRKALLSGLFRLLGFFGNGSDGNVSISGTVTLTRDMYYNDLAVPAGQTLNPNGYRVFVAGTISGTGTINRNGNNASGTTAGTKLNAGSLNGERQAGAGGASVTNNVGINGTAGEASNPSLTNINGVAGGAGGASGAGAGGSAGGAGTATRGSNYNQVLKPIGYLLHGATTQSITGYLESYLSIPASGGGGSGGAGTASPSGAGGGGGGNGGLNWFAVYNWNFTGTCTATGGNGANGGTASGGTYQGGGGGGGGGNGGIFFRVVAIITADATFTLTGGTGGTGGGGTAPGVSGANGTAGNAGELISVNISNLLT